ncbi:cytochrome P450, partial [Mycena pura]
TVNLCIGWDDFIFTTEPEYVKIILATDFANKSVSLSIFSFSESFTHSIYLGTCGHWKSHRGATRPSFNRDRISDFDIFAHHADRAIDDMKERMRAGYAVDFQDLACRFTMNSATSVLFGSCVNSLSAPLPYPSNASTPFLASASSNRGDIFTEAYTTAITHISSLSRFGWIWVFLELTGDATRAPMRVVDPYLEPIIAAAVARKEALKAERAPKGEPETLLDDELLNLTSGKVFFYY